MNGRGLHFIPDGDRAGGALSFIFSEIESATGTPEKSFLNIRPGKGSPIRQIVFNDPGFYSAFRECRQSSAGGPFKLLPGSFQALPVAGRIAVLAACIMLLLGAIYLSLVNVYTLLPVEADLKVGENIALKIEKQFSVLKPGKDQAAAERLVRKLRPKDSPYDYSVRVIDNPDVNAFTLPDGRIYIFSGFFTAAKNRGELAGVLAHEIAHVEKRHGIQQLIRGAGILFFTKLVIGSGFDVMTFAENLSELSGMALVLKYSREAEDEADSDAVAILGRAGMRADGLVSFLEKNASPKNGIVVPVYLSTHPASEERVKAIKERVKEYKKTGK